MGWAIIRFDSSFLWLCGGLCGMHKHDVYLFPGQDMEPQLVYRKADPLGWRTCTRRKAQFLGCAIGHDPALDRQNCTPPDAGFCEAEKINISRRKRPVGYEIKRIDTWSK
jgi:hypothetical protein